MEKKLRICVYAISKNEAHFVQRFCASAADTDLIMIADTGSDDGLPEQAEACGATVHHIAITPWRFDLARNAALALVPRDMDVCIYGPSLHHAKIAHELEPDDARLAANLDYIRKAISGEQQEAA